MSIVAAATLLAVRRPLAAVQVTFGLLVAVIVVWVLLCGVGIAVQLEQGTGMEAVGRETPFLSSDPLGD